MAGLLRVRWLGRVPYEEAHALQRALHRESSDDYLLLLEHPHVFTLGVRGDPDHLLVDAAEVGATLVRTDRGGDITYHGPGQLVAYPVLTVPMGHDAVPCHVHGVEQLVIDTLAHFGLTAGRLVGFPGVWMEPEGARPRKIAAVGIKVARGRSMHGLALNVAPDLAWFDRIVPCGIVDKGVTSMRAEGVGASWDEVAEVLAELGARRWGAEGRTVERQDVARPPVRAEPEPSGGREPGRALRIRLRQAGTDPDDGLELSCRKPPWLRVRAAMGPDYLSLRRTLRGLDLVTVCEEAGCPNIFECWADGTATFMINGARCTRACGFCDVETGKPSPLDRAEPEKVAEAVDRLGLAHAVVTAVARDDLSDGGASAFVAVIEAVRRRCPGTRVEVLIPDFKGDRAALQAVLDARPDVLNHNLETVARLQRAVRPSAGYARSLALLARAGEAGLTTKSGLILGMGETEAEVRGALADLRAVGVSLVTVGQYLRPSVTHLPVARWWTPAEFDRLAGHGRALGFAHVQASPLTRSSYHARTSASAVASAAAAGEPDPPRPAAGVGVSARCATVPACSAS